MNLRTDRDGAILTITLDRPPAHAFDDTLSKELGEVLVDYQNDPDLLCAILTANGDKFFSGGSDLKWGANGGMNLRPEEYGPGGFAGLSEFWQLTKPVVAALNGMAVGAGFEIALACDIIVAAEHVQFWLPEVQRGFIAGSGGVIRLPRLVPYQLAMEMLLCCEWKTAEDLHRFGVVNVVVPPEELMDVARTYADKIACAAPLAVRATKSVWHETAHLSIKDAFAAMHDGQVAEHELMKASPDYTSGSAAFANKTQPVWSGK